MGLFGFIKKGLGKVVKLGLGQLTGGLSDKALQAMQASNQAKTAAKQAQAQMETMQRMAQMVKLAPTMAPISTNQAMMPLRKAASGSGGARKVTKRKKAAPRKAARVPTRTPSKRRAPRGGLQLRAMAAEWRAAGKPGTWQGWIKTNPIKGG